MPPQIRIRSVTLFHTGLLRLWNRAVCAEAAPGFGFHPLSCALIDHPRQGPVLFDTGLGSRAAQALGLRVGPLPIPRWIMRGVASLVFDPALDPLLTKLRALGVDGGSVRHVVMSHLHVDHTGGMQDLPQALFHVSKTEWDRRPIQDSAAALLRGWRPCDYNGAAVNPIEYQTELPYEPFTQGHDLFGDGSLFLLPTPGHTHGHQSLLVRLESGRSLLLLGDAVYMARCVYGPYEITKAARIFRANDPLAWETVQRLHALRQHNPDITMIACHDPALGARLRRHPVVYV